MGGFNPQVASSAEAAVRTIASAKDVDGAIRILSRELELLKKSRGLTAAPRKTVARRAKTAKRKA